MGLKEIGATLPPGFKFYPSDEELVCHYLYKKIAKDDIDKGTLVEIDLHTCEPWQLPDVAKLNAKEWYFFSFRDRKYATGYRTNRATISGYWKATGKDRLVINPITRELVGMRKTLVFYQNRAPNGIKSGWIMHEFRLETPHMPPKEDWVLCRVFHKGKAEDTDNRNTNIHSPQSMFASQEIKTSNTSDLSHQNHVSLSMLNPNLFQVNTRDQIRTPVTAACSAHLTEMSNRGDHEVDNYGVLWDVSLEENTTGFLMQIDTGHERQIYIDNEIPTSDIRFEVDNSIVFL